MTLLTDRTLVLLDLDGTIAEPRVGIINGYRAAFRAVGLLAPPDETIAAWIGPPLREAFPQLGIPAAQIELAVTGYRDVYNETGWLENELYPRLPDVVRELGQRGPMSLATAKPTGLASRILGHFELLHLFDFVGGASLDTSRDSKSAVIAHCLDELGHDPADAVMVGDRAADVAGAAEHGIPTVGVLWGHGTEDELRDAGAVELVDEPRQLLDLLR